MLTGEGLPPTESELFKLNDYPILDENKGIECIGEKKQLQEMLIVTLEEIIPKETLDIEKAHCAHDWNKVQKIAHKMKGGSLYCGTVRMTIACQYMERYYKAGNKKLLEELYQQLIAVIEQTQRVIQLWLKTEKRNNLHKL